VRPLIAGELPDEINVMMETHMSNQSIILKAGLTRDLKLAFAAFINDPLVKNISNSQAQALFDEMLMNTRAYLTTY
jgi:alpha-galactosidase